MKKFRKEHGEPDVIEIRQTFNDSLQAREWEHKVLRRLKVGRNDRWLNLGTGKAIPPMRGVDHPWYGRKHSEETKDKIGEWARNRPPEAIEKMRQYALNRTPEHLAKIAETSRGRKHSDETKAKMSAASSENYRKMTPEQRSKLMCPREKNGMLGKTHSEETKRKISVKARNRSAEWSENHSKIIKNTVSCLDIETGTVSRISSEEFWSNKDRYFGPRSEEYQVWKANTKLQPT